ncbi:uncharacterized protein CEXT_704521 [Caerostris extrusa]|uniref:Uncharacterized protein n=1 Tax=Caerostris extrusa TaxID=172846 RepID=A0AAV4NRJ3_CAEEX|nr:uncharacterized protein CEXT_704521 [Caerostris extrusa]
MDLEDEAADDFLRLQGRQWNMYNSSEPAVCDFSLGNPFRKKHQDVVRMGNQSHKMNIHSGKISKNVNFSLPKCLAFRENGMASESDFEAQVLKMKLKQLRLVSNSRVGFSDYINSYYIKGFKKDLIGAWTYHEYSATLLKSISFQCAKLDSKNNTVQSSITDIYCADIANLPNYKIFDLCGLSCGDQDYVLYVANSYSRHKNIAHLAPIGVNEWGDQQDDIVRRFEHHEILWSCSWNSFQQRFAIGADRCFYLHDYQSFSKKIDLPKGQPYSLILIVMEICYTVAFTVVDLRIKKATFQYPNHYSLYKKLVFSLNESVNVLCASGEDNITRLWSLKEGKLLHSLPLTHQDYCGQINSFLEADGRRMFVHILFGDSIHTYETLEDVVQELEVLQLNARPLY